MTLPKRAHYFNPRRHTYAYEQDFVPGCLYLMLMVPDSVFYGERTHDYPAMPAEDVRYTTYDAVAANSKGEVLEEFDWELYWHQGPEGGKIYRIEKNDNAPPNYGYERIDVEDIRNIPQCVGFIRLFSTRESAIADVERCVDWTTRSAAQGCRRTFAWATMCIHRIRRQFHPAEGLVALDFYSFDMSVFVVEVLTFAYGHIKAAMKGKRIRSPITPSWFNFDITHNTLKASLPTPRCNALSRRSRWFNQHPESAWYITAQNRPQMAAEGDGLDTAV